MRIDFGQYPHRLRSICEEIPLRPQEGKLDPTIGSLACKSRANPRQKSSPPFRFWGLMAFMFGPRFWLLSPDVCARLDLCLRSANAIDMPENRGGLGGVNWPRPSKYIALSRC